MTDQPRNAHASIRKHLVVGLAVVLVLGGGVGGWAATVPISGALIAPGSVVVDTNVK
ncbi:MAG: HlyD family type I secretion periplasmic adaptor subunit, partial [Bradyrhizobium sp.]